MNPLELKEIEALEDLKVATWLVKQRADAFAEDSRDNYDEDDGGSAWAYSHPLEAACRILHRCKQRHMELFAEWTEERDRQRQKHADDQKVADFRTRQQAAHSAVAAAVADGRLIRPKICARCGNESTTIIAHHEDYSKPLDVEWLCAKCHGKHHAEHGSAT